MSPGLTTNLIKIFLCEVAGVVLGQIDPALRRRCPVERAVFNFEIRSWQTRSYELHGPGITGAIAI